LLLKCDIHHNLFFDDGKNYVQKASSRAKSVDESVYEEYVERKLRLGGVGIRSGQRIWAQSPLLYDLLLQTLNNFLVWNDAEYDASGDKMTSRIE